ncbi:MAG: acyclic terpene utilization AtuA family protein, partial [Pseudomonadota bacterium]
MPREIRIGGAAGYWGDSPEAARQLVLSGDIDYLIGDYLAEVTMSILVRMKQRDPQSGYARDFVTLVMAPLLKEIHARKIRVVVNAGGINVAACASALATVARQADVPIGIASVTGDDVMPLIDQLRAEEIREMFSGAALPETVISANAYLGAFPIAAALDRGADVVITGRCADSALTLGPLVHEFRWGAAELDRLAAGSLAGHILECGAQATGGNFTDWSDVADGWDNVGYPIAVCRADGTFDITKPPGTGGRVSRLSVGEQILYETGDPRAYVLPDVVCDFSETTLEEMSGEVVRVSGVRGRPPTDSYKVSATYCDGWRATALTGITGFDAPAKAQAYGAAL